jgi:hypothetical protein
VLSDGSLQCGGKYPVNQPKKPLQEIDGVVVICQNQDGRLLERATRKVVGGKTPIYGASVGLDWDLPARGAALYHWTENKKMCDRMIEQTIMREKRRAQKEADRLRESHGEL